MLKYPETVIPNGVCEARLLRPVRFVGVRNLSFLGILIEEGLIAQKTRDGEPRFTWNDGGRLFRQAARGWLLYLFVVPGLASTPKSHTNRFIPSGRSSASTYSPGGSGALSVNR